MPIYVIIYAHTYTHTYTHTHTHTHTHECWPSSSKFCIHKRPLSHEFLSVVCTRTHWHVTWRVHTRHVSSTPPLCPCSVFRLCGAWLISMRHHAFLRKHIFHPLFLFLFLAHSLSLGHADPTVLCDLEPKISQKTPHGVATISRLLQIIGLLGRI